MSELQSLCGAPALNGTEGVGEIEISPTPSVRLVNRFFCLRRYGAFSFFAGAARVADRYWPP